MAEERYNVIFAEKPSVARSIASALGKNPGNGDGYIKIDWNGPTYVTYGFGHLVSLFEPNDYDEKNRMWKGISSPIIPETHKLKIKDSAKKQFSVVKKLFCGASLIINATDPDREGEVIFAYVYQMANCKTPFKRAYFVSQNADAFREAFSKLVEPEVVRPLENAGRMRGIADWLVGMNLTIADSVHCNTFMSVGRVQTPTLAMVVDREKKIRNFRSEKYYVPQAVFAKKSGETYKGEYSVKEKITDRAEAEKITGRLTGDATVTGVEKKMRKVFTPPLYSLGTLQMEASSKCGFSAQKTLDIVQGLYEKGYVTYPRTSSAYLPSDYRPNAVSALNSLKRMSEYAPFLEGRKFSFHPKYFDDSKVDAHFAIVPTHITPKSLTPDQKKIFDLIARSLIITIYPDAVVEDTKVVTEDNGGKFNSKGSVIITKGWMEVSSASKETVLPPLTEGEAVKGRYELAEKETEPPKRYTDKTLIAAMIAADKDSDNKDILSLSDLGVAGIGTEATRAGIIENLVNRGYMERIKKSFAATDKGIALIDNLPVEEVKSATLTAEWENRLNNIAKGTENPGAFQKDIENKVREWWSTIKTAQRVSSYTEAPKTAAKLICPHCGKEVRKNSKGYGCVGYKDGCKFFIGEKIAGKKLTETQIKTLCEKGETKKIEGFTSKAGKKFGARLKVGPDGKIEFSFE